MWKVIGTVLLIAAISSSSADPSTAVNGFFPDIFNSSQTLKDALAWITVAQAAAEKPSEFVGNLSYPFEEHQVTTADGYILTMFRIPYGKNNGTVSKKRQPVLVQHGVMSSAMDFLVTGPERGLGFILADAGYDVWLANSRGNAYSQNHNSLNSESKQFWQFSWHEIGILDLPAQIDYIISHTRYSKVHFIGQGQGNTAYFVMASEKPAEQNRIQSVNALSPAVFMSNLKSPFIRILAPMSGMISTIFNYTSSGEFPGQGDLIDQMGYYLCTKQAILTQMCINSVYLVSGYGSDQIDPEQVTNIIKYSPSSSSFYQLIHYAQLFNSGEFRQYDYGYVENLKRYRSEIPPDYDLSKVTNKVSLYYSNNDWLSSVEDVEKLANKLPNIFGKFQIPNLKFSHVDFYWGKQANEEVYQQVLKVMAEYPIQKAGTY